MKTIVKFRADDGSEWAKPEDAEARDHLCAQVAVVMAPLGSTPKEVKDGKGWLQHNPETVLRVKDAFGVLCFEHGFNFKGAGRDWHPFSIVGRVLSDTGGPLDDAWHRFQRIDADGREHEQPYYANSGPSPLHVCIEDRTNSPHA